MLGEVQQGLEVVSFPGWRVELVGGGRRSAASHDAGGWPGLGGASLHAP
jgi:hypothetical protein